MWSRSRRFDCILPVFFRQWGRLVMRDLIKHDALLWLVVFSTALIGAFRSLLFTQWFTPSAVRCRTALLLLCFLIVGIHASGISIPLSLLILLGWSLIWIASLTLRMYYWGSRSINFNSFQSGLCPVVWVCSETAEVSVRASRLSFRGFHYFGNRSARS